MKEFDANVNLVYYVFNKDFASHRDKEEDLVQEGMIGLWKACQTFDPARKNSFATYATVCIKNQMAMYIRKETKRVNQTVSLDAFINKEGKDTYIDILAAPEDKPNDAVLLDAIMKEAQNSDCYAILQLKLKGETQAQIAEELGISQSSVSEKIRRFYANIRSKYAQKD